MELMLMVAFSSLLFVLGSWWYLSREEEHKQKK